MSEKEIKRNEKGQFVAGCGGPGRGHKSKTEPDRDSPENLAFLEGLDDSKLAALPRETLHCLADSATSESVRGSAAKALLGYYQKDGRSFQW